MRGHLNVVPLLMSRGFTHMPGMFGRLTPYKGNISHRPGCYSCYMEGSPGKRKRPAVAGEKGCTAPPPQPADSIFLSEWLAGNRPPNQLPISAVCNSHCIFCSNRLNPFPVATGLFRDMADVKHQLSLMPAHRDPIRLSDSLPGRIAEGEAFLHPQFFEILSLIRHKFVGNTLCFTTNASMLDEPFLKKLAAYRPI